MFSHVPRIAPPPPRQVPTAGTPQTHAILGCRKATSVRPVDSGSRAVVAAARLPPELVRIELHGATTHGINHGAEAAMVILVHRIGTAAIGR